EVRLGLWADQFHEEASVVLPAERERVERSPQRWRGIRKVVISEILKKFGWCEWLGGRFALWDPSRSKTNRNRPPARLLDNSRDTLRVRRKNGGAFLVCECELWCI